MVVIPQTKQPCHPYQPELEHSDLEKDNYSQSFDDEKSKTKMSPVFSGVESMEEISDAEERFQSVVHQLNLTIKTGCAEEKCKTIVSGTGKGETEEATFVAAVVSLYKTYCSNKACHTMLDYLQELHFSTQSDSRDCIPTSGALIPFSSCLPGSMITEAKVEKTAFDQHLERWHRAHDSGMICKQNTKGNYEPLINIWVKFLLRQSFIASNIKVSIFIAYIFEAHKSLTNKGTSPQLIKAHEKCNNAKKHRVDLGRIAEALDTVDGNNPSDPARQTKENSKVSQSPQLTDHSCGHTIDEQSYSNPYDESDLYSIMSSLSADESLAHQDNDDDDNALFHQAPKRVVHSPCTPPREHSPPSIFRNQLHRSSSARQLRSLTHHHHHRNLSSGAVSYKSLCNMSRPPIIRHSKSMGSAPMTTTTTDSSSPLLSDAISSIINRGPNPQLRHHHFHHRHSYSEPAFHIPDDVILMDDNAVENIPLPDLDICPDTQLLGSRPRRANYPNNSNNNQDQRSRLGSWSTETTGFSSSTSYSMSNEYNNNNNHPSFSSPKNYLKKQKSKSKNVVTEEIKYKVGKMNILSPVRPLGRRLGSFRKSKRAGRNDHKVVLERSDSGFLT